jgi:hypothetical protein
MLDIPSQQRTAIATGRELTFGQAQRDMRHAYFGGAPGVFVSSLAWLAAGIVALSQPPARVVLALFAGGMLIHPLSLLLCKLLGRPGAHAKGNPLGALALESTVWMLLGMILAFGLSLWRAELFLPAMLLIIGGRYLTFATVYGMWLYRACGLALAAVGFALGALSAPMAVGAFTGAAIEMIFAAALYLPSRQDAGQ